MTTFFGRIDVYWPDGPIESYRLNKPTVAVGRSVGNDIVLDTTAVSRYHVTLTFTNQQMILEDLQSVNGTYVDGVPLPSNEPYVLRGGEEIQVGDVRLIFHPPADTLAFAEDTTQRITLSQPTYQVELEEPKMAVAPGAHVQSSLKIENTGDQTDRYYVEIEGLPKGWARVDRLEMEIDPGESAQAVISYKPLRRSDSRPGEYPFVVRVRAKSTPAQTLDAPTMLHVLPFSGFGMALEKPRITNGHTFTLYVHNQGSAPLGLGLQGSDRASALAFTFPSTRLVLGPGERRVITGAVRPRRRRWFGAERDVEFAISARSEDQSHFLASVPGHVIDRGLLPTWVPVVALPVMAFLTVLAIGALLLVLGGGDDDNPTTDETGTATSLPTTVPTTIAQSTIPVMPTPVVTSFSVSSASVEAGESVELNWEIEAGAPVVIRVEGPGDPQEITPEAGATSVRIQLDAPGTYDITLQAGPEEAPVESTVRVEVQPASVEPAILTFAPAQPSVAVGAPVQLAWEVQGVDSVSILAERDGVSQTYTPPAGATSYELTFDQTGRYQLILEARGGEAVTSTLAVIEVVPAVTLAVDVVDGEALVNYVEDQVARVTWVVSGALALDGGYDIRLDSDLAAALLPDAPLPESSFWDVLLTPLGEAESWTVTLVAQGQDGLAASTTVTLDIVDPHCTLEADMRVVLTGPGDSYPTLEPNRVRPADATISLAPVARDASGDWLQGEFGLDRRLGWVKRADYACTNFDPARLLVTSEYPAPPTPTAVPRGTRTPSAGSSSTTGSPATPTRSPASN